MFLQRRRCRQRYNAYARTGRVGIPTYARSTLSSSKERSTQGKSQRPPAESTMGVPGRPSTTHVAHRGDLPGVGMNNNAPDSEGDNRHKRNRPAGEIVEGSGGAD